MIEETPELATEPPGGTQPLTRKTKSLTNGFRKRFFPGVAADQWNDWRWQMRNRLLSGKDIARILELAGAEEMALGNAHGHSGLPMAVTPYYLGLFWDKGPENPLRRTVVPSACELIAKDDEEADPLAEDRDSPAPGLVHRYPDRVLFLATGVCFAYCRYCTRSRAVGRNAGLAPSRKRWELCLQYIASHPEVRDVIISGGDPLTLDDGSLEWLLSRLRRIPHVDMLRIGTKAPMVLPQRVTPALARMLRKYHPLFVSVHATHPEELTSESSRALERLADAGAPLGSQTVLLRGVNDDPVIMKQLMLGLLRRRVRPYYLYQCDPVPGTAHFRTPVETGLEMIRSLRGHTSGYAVPSFVIDAPGGGGKIPLLPEYCMGRSEGGLELRNYQGKTYRYPDHAGERTQASAWEHA